MNINIGIFALAVMLTLFIGREVSSRRTRLGSMVLLGALLLLAPRFSDNIAILTPVFIAVMLGTGWNIIGGFTGYGSFGQVAFFGVGAFTLAAIISRAPGFLGLPAPVGLLVAPLACAAYALVISVPILRLRGHYFAISTLAFGFATQQLVKNLGFFGGSTGIATPILRRQVILGLTIPRDDYFYYLTLIAAAACLALSALVLRSKFGYGLQAIRENEDAALSMGVNTTLYKIQAFVIAAAITGFAGAMQAYFRSGASPEDDGVFQTRFNLLPLIVVLLGGIGSVWGPVIGAFTYLGIEYVITTASGTSTIVQDWDRVITGAVIVVVVVLLPRGLIQLVGGRSLSWRIFIDNIRSTRV